MQVVSPFECSKSKEMHRNWKGSYYCKNIASQTCIWTQVWISRYLITKLLCTERIKDWARCSTICHPGSTFKLKILNWDKCWLFMTNMLQLDARLPPNKLFSQVTLCRLNYSKETKSVTRIQSKAEASFMLSLLMESPHAEIMWIT